MKKKSVAVIVWIISAVIAVGVGITSLSQGCVHSYTETITREATCYQEGEKTLTCTRCRESKTETMPMKEHSLSSWKTSVTATCTLTGLKTRSCTNKGCSYSESQSVSKLSHNLVVIEEVEPTCDKGGEKVYECSVCGGGRKTETVRATGHKFTVTVETNATQDNDGNWVPVDTDTWTCSTTLYNTHTVCENCGTPDDDYEVYQTSHFTDDGWVVTKAPTCTREGLAVQSCQVDGCPNEGKQETKNLPKIEHSWVYVDAVKATCMSAGYNRHQKCEHCGETKGYVVEEKLDHKFNNDGECVLSYKDADGQNYTCGTQTYNYTLSADGTYYILTSINKNSVSENRTEFNIPAEYNGKPVKEIADGVFNGFTYVKKITITENIVHIGKSAFKNCTSLVEVTLREDNARNTSLDESIVVGDYAFEGCAKLNKFDFSNVKEIGENAFHGTAFTEIVLTDKVASIGSRAFEATSKLTAMTVPFVGLNANTPAVFGVIFGSNNYNVPKTLKTVTVLSATKLVDGAFESIGSLEKVVLPDTCVEFGKSAFEDCTALTEIYLGENKNHFYNETKEIKLGEAMLKGTKLSSLVLPYLGNGSNITNLGYLYGSNEMVSSSLTSVTLPTVTEVKSDAFAGCANIVTIKFGKLTKIESFAFNGCTSLKNIITNDLVAENVYLGTDIEFIGKGAFAGCTSITNLTVPFLGETITATEERNLGYFFGASDNSNLDGINNLSLTSVTVLQCNENSILDAYAFAGFAKLVNVSIPAVAEIGESAFAGCKALQNVYYGANTTANDFVEITMDGETKTTVAPAKIGEAAFKGCFTMNTKSFAMVLPFIGEAGEGNDIGSTFGYIFGGVQYAPTKLTEVEIKSEDATFVVSDFAFQDFKYLEKIVLPSTLTNIGIYAFDGCTNLNDFSFLQDCETLETIGEYAFRNCRSLTEIVIPENVKYIGIAAFNGCNGLCEMTLPFVGQALDTTGLNSAQQAFGYIFNASGSTLMQGNSMPIYLTTVVITGGTKIVGQAFYGCTRIQYITLPATVTSIGSEAFKECTALKEVIFEGVEDELEGEAQWNIASIEKQTFYNCTSLEKVVLPKTVKNIGESAFYNCKKLSTFRTAGEDGNVLEVDKIAMSAFSNAFNMNGYVSLTLKNVQEIVYKAFEVTGFKTLTITWDEGGCQPVLGNYVFYASRVTTVNLSSDFELISASMFDSCSYLTNFKMPENIRVIQDYAFKDCKKLTINATHENFAGRNALVFDHAVEIKNNAFENCIALKELVFINSDTYAWDEENTFKMSIGEKAFFGCSGITHIYLTAEAIEINLGGEVKVTGIQAIGAYAFGCSGTLPVNIYINTTESEASSNYLWNADCFQGAYLENKDKTYADENVSFEDYIANYSLYGVAIEAEEEI